MSRGRVGLNAADLLADTGGGVALEALPVAAVVDSSTWSARTRASGQAAWLKGAWPSRPSDASSGDNTG